MPEALALRREAVALARFAGKHQVEAAAPFAGVRS
jgi:hypothetical protein